jgi:ubiquinone/menaquinone biosynthesis C-methylase UbiE
LDVSRKSLDLGRSRFGEIAEFIHFDGGEPPIPDKSIDIILCACVFHHIPHDQHQKILVGLRRKLSERGLLFLFEHNPLNPLTVRAVDTCPFDENAKLITSWKLSESLKLAGFATVETRFRIFFPGLLRKLRPLETYLYWLPLGAQYCLIAA